MSRPISPKPAPKRRKIVAVKRTAKKSEAKFVQIAAACAGNGTMLLFALDADGGVWARADYTAPEWERLNYPRCG